MGEPEEADREQDLRDLQGQEDREHCNGDPQAPQHHVGVEDREREQEPRQPVVDVDGLERASDLRRLEEHDGDAESEPEAAVGRERGRAKDVPVPELPHTGEQLGNASVEEGQSDPEDVRDEGRVVAAEHEGGEREPRKSERGGIGDRHELHQRRGSALLGEDSHINLLG